MRSRAKWVECGEKSTRYFLGLEKTRQSANCITCLKDADGIPHHSDAEILKVAKSYYERLYKSNASQEDDIDLFLESLPKERILRRHLLDNLDDKPADETERAPMKNKISFSYCFFILTHRASPVSGPLHRLATAQQAFSSAQCHSSRLTSLVR